MKILSLVLITLLITGNSVFAQNSIQIAIDAFAKDDGLRNASISFKMIDLTTNDVIAEYDPKRTLPTASTAKLISTATAIELLGADYQPITRIYYDGTVDSNGVLNGDLWIRGGGDPTIGSKYFNEESDQYFVLNEWVQKIKNAGINSVNGSIIADASEFGYEGVPDGWNWVDMGNYYGAGPSGLSIYDNMLKVYFTTGSTAGERTKISSMEPEIPNLKIRNYVTSSTRKGDNVYFYGAPFSNDKFASGTLPINSNRFLVKASIPDAEYLFGIELLKAMTENNLSVAKGVSTGRSKGLNSSDKSYENLKLIYSHKGPKLAEIIKHTNMTSVNLFAEHMINLSAYEKTGNGSTAKGLALLEDYWSKKMNTSGMQINDGSGLSRSNAISAEHFVNLLRLMSLSSNYNSYLSSLPVAGSSGTLRNVCKGQAAAGRMFAKSGSMTRIKSYAGYIESTSGKKYAFALIVNNYTCSSSSLKSKMEGIFNKMAIH